MQVFDASKSSGDALWRLDMMSGLAMGYNAETGLLCSGGFNGMCSLVYDFSPSPVEYLSKQSVRYLKQQLALRKKGWEGLSEKSEFVDKLLQSFDKEIPTFSAAAEFSGGTQGLVDILVDNDNRIYTGGWEGKIGVYQASSNRGSAPEKVATLSGHANATNCLRKFQGEGTTLFSGGSDGFVRSFDLETSLVIDQYPISNAWIWCLEQGDSPNTFFAAGVDHCIRQVDRRCSGRVVWTGMLPAEVSGLSVVACNNLMAAACFDGCARLYDTRKLSVFHWSKRLSHERLTRCVLTDSQLMCGGFDSFVHVVEF